MKLRVLAVLLCALAARAPHANAQQRFWRPDDRILITSFLNARGIATDHRHVWVATEFGLETYDIDFKRWLPPLTIEDGYPVMERPGRIAYDQRDRVLWLFTDAQSLYAYSPAMQWWERRTQAELTAEMREKLLRGGEQRDPAWAILRNFIGRDATARSFPITAVEPAERNGTFWAATMGNNFSFADTRNLSSESYAFGSISRGVSALAVDERGNMYFGGDGQSTRNGIVRSDSTLQQWRHYESRIAEGPRNRAHAMAATSSGIYAGASDGLFRLREERWQRVLDMEVHAIAATSGRVWIGSRGQLGWLDDSGNFSPVAEFPLQDVYRLATRGDTVWIAASRGLFQYSGNALRQLLSSTTFGVAATNNAVIAVTSRGVISREAEGWVDVPGHASYDAIGRFVSIDAHGDRVWFGGVTGLAEWNTATNTWRHLRVPDDIPEGPIYDVVYQNGRLWLATPAGALGVIWK